MIVVYDAEYVRGMLRGEIAKAGGLAKLAKSWGCGHSYISQVLSGRDTPGPKILGKLKLQRIVMFTPKK